MESELCSLSDSGFVDLLGINLIQIINLKLFEFVIVPDD